MRMQLGCLHHLPRRPAIPAGGERSQAFLKLQGLFSAWSRGKAASDEDLADASESHVEFSSDQKDSVADRNEVMEREAIMLSDDSFVLDQSGILEDNIASSGNDTSFATGEAPSTGKRPMKSRKMNVDNEISSTSSNGKKLSESKVKEVHRISLQSGGRQELRRILSEMISSGKEVDDKKTKSDGNSQSMNELKSFFELNVNKKNNIGTGTSALIHSFSKPQQESVRSSKVLPQGRPLEDGSDDDDDDDDDDDAFADLGCPQESCQDSGSKVSSGSSVLNLHLLPEVSERKKLQRTASLRSASINEKDEGRDVSEYMNHRQLTSGAFSSSKVEAMNSEALERENLLRTTSLRSALINEKDMGRGVPENRKNQQLTSGAFSSLKAKGMNGHSKREESLGLKIGERVPLREFKNVICVGNIPSNFNFNQIKEAVSRHGVITRMFRRPGRKGLIEYYFEFQTEEAKDNALADKWLHIDRQRFPISRQDRPMTTVVRISNVSSFTTKRNILSICSNYGKVDQLKMREDGIFDIYFEVKELPNMPSILDRLNEAIINQNRWKAQPAPLMHPQMRNGMLLSKEGVTWFNTQVNMLFEKMDTAVNSYFTNVQALKEMFSSRKQ